MGCLIVTKITKKRYQEAVKNSGGIISFIAKRLKVSRTAVYDYIKKNDWAGEMVKGEVEAINDLAEAKLIEHIKKGQPWAIQFRLKTKAKNRGYTEKQEIEQAGGFSNNMRIEVVDYDSKLHSEQETEKHY